MAKGFVLELVGTFLYVMTFGVQILSLPIINLSTQEKKRKKKKEKRKKKKKNLLQDS